MIRKIILPAIACVALAAGCASTATIHSSTSSTPQAAAATSSAPAPAPSSPPAPQFTPEQQQALDSAASYLNDGQGFSRAGLISQLTSSYGEGFSHKLALFAIRELHPNWNKQAVLSARSYVQSGQGFSFNGLVQQLESPYGEQFTHAQAVHGATVALRG